MRSLISQNTAVKIYNALIQPRFDSVPPFGWIEFLSMRETTKFAKPRSWVILQASYEDSRDA